MASPVSPISSPAAGASGTGSGSPSPAPGGGSPPSSNPGTPSGGAAPITPPGTPGAAGSPANNGPVDYTRFEEVNSRLGRVSWAEEYDQNEVAEATRLWRWFDQDPEGAYDYVSGLMDRRGGNTRRPAAGAGQPQGTPNYPVNKDGRPLPDVRIQETGQTFYSAEQADRLIEWQEQNLDNRIRAVEGNLTRTAAQEEARTVIADAERRLPHFRQHAQEIFKAMEKDKRLSVDGAYNRVVVPRLREIERAALAEEARTRAAAGSGVNNPGAPAPAASAELKKLPMKELFRREMLKRGLGK